MLSLYSYVEVAHEHLSPLVFKTFKHSLRLVSAVSSASDRASNEQPRQRTEKTLVDMLIRRPK